MIVLIRESPGQELPDDNVRAIIQRSLLALLARADMAAAEVSVAIVGDEEMRELNRAYRGVDAPTDVLSFSQLSPGDGDDQPLPRGETVPPEAFPPDVLAGALGSMGPAQTWVAPLLLGDVVISLPRARHQAERYGHSLAREMAFLAVHGALHLLGYDHDTPEAEGEMNREAEAVLAEMGLDR